MPGQPAGEQSTQTRTAAYSRQTRESSCVTNEAASMCEDDATVPYSREEVS